jgi:hypothetical protein
MGNYALNTTDWNFTITKTDSQFLNYWNESQNRKVIIRGIFMDSNSSFKDEINVTGLFVELGPLFINDTWQAFPIGGTEDWSNVTKTLPSTAGMTIKWKIYANDTSNNWNASSVYSFVTTSPIYQISTDYIQIIVSADTLQDSSCWDTDFTFTQGNDYTLMVTYDSIQENITIGTKVNQGIYVGFFDITLIGSETTYKDKFQKNYTLP